MSDLWGGYKSQTTLGLQRIDSSKYPDTNKDFEANIQRLNGFVDYISQYLQQMQKGVDQATKDPITQLRDTVLNIGVALGGGALLDGIDLGDLQYFLPALGAMFGFDNGQPFPLNLFTAAEHFLLGYIVPLDSFGYVIEDLIDGWAAALGLSPEFIASLHTIIDAIQSVTTDLEGLLTNVLSLFSVFGIDSSGFGPFGDLWHAVTKLLGSFSIQDLGALVDPVFNTLAPWISDVAQFVDFLDQIIKAFSGGITNLQGILNFSKLFTPFVTFITTGAFDPVTALISWITNGIKPTNLLAPLTGGLLSSLNIPLLDSSKITGQFDMSRINGLITAFTGIDLTSGTPIQDYIDSSIAFLQDFLHKGLDSELASFYALLSGIDLTSDNPVKDYIDGAVAFLQDFLHKGLEADLANFYAMLTGIDLTSDNPVKDYIDNVTSFIQDFLHKGLQGELANLYATIISAFSGSGTNISDVLTAMKNIPGLNIISLLLSTVIPALDGSKIQSGLISQSFLSITSIAGSIISGLLSTLNIPTLDGSKIGSGLISQAFLGITSIASTLITGVLSTLAIPLIDASKIFSGILNISRIPTTDISIGNTTILQQMIDNFTQAFYGDDTILGTTVGQTKGSFQAIRQQLLEHTKALQALTSTTQAQNNSGVNITVDFGQYADGNIPSMFTVTYTGSGTSTVGIVNGNSCWNVQNNDGNRNAFVIYNLGPTNTDFQIIRGVMSQAPSDPSSGGTPMIWGLGRVDSVTNPQNFVWFRAYSTGFFTWKADIGCRKAGVDYVWQSNIPLGWNLNTYLVVGANGNLNRHQLWAGTTLVKDYTEVGTQSGGFSNSGSGFRNWGAQSQIKTGASNPSTPGKIGGCSTSDNAPPTTIGSFGRVYRLSTGNAGQVGVSSTPNVFVANTFDTEDRRSQDMTFNYATGEWTVTVEGTYLASMGCYNNAGQANGTITRCGFFYRPAPVAGVTQAQVGIRPSNDIPVQTAAQQVRYAHTEEVYLKAGDSLAAGIANSSTGVNPNGDSTSTKTWFSLSLVNHSLN